MIKDIVVNLSVSNRQGHAAENYAISMACALGAHVTGIAFSYGPSIPMPYPLLGYGETPPEVLDALKREAAALAKGAQDRFAKAASAASVPAGSQTLRTSFADSSVRFGRIARCFDLAVVGQVEPGTDAYESKIAEGALFDSGRPMIIVPYGNTKGFGLDRVMVCWDGGASAAHTIAEAMPLLERAGRIELVIVTTERGKQDETEGADIGQHLARRGLQAEIQRIVKGHATIADTLLAHAADSAADIMVMGGHGHSRVHEFFLGNVTEPVLRSAKVPVFMSH